MKNFKTIMTPLLIALTMGTFTACSESSSNNTTDTDNTNKYIINETESKDVPLNAQILSVSTQEAQVKLTRDIEAEIVNVHVLSGSVEVTEATMEE